jgi:hypothetical protein
MPRATIAVGFLLLVMLQVAAVLASPVATSYVKLPGTPPDAGLLLAVGTALLVLTAARGRRPRI